MSFINLVSRELKPLLITRIKSLLCQRKLNYSNFQGHRNIQRGSFDNPKNNAITKESKSGLAMEDWLQLHLLSGAEGALALPPKSYGLGHPSQSGLPVQLATGCNSSTLWGEGRTLLMNRLMLRQSSDEAQSRGGEKNNIIA